MSIESTPTEEQIATLHSLPMDAPIAALNLFKFNERAQYRPEDPEFQSSSRHRYAAFAKHSMMHISGDPSST